MLQNPYYYFLNLYKNSSDTLLCVDEQLRIVYISNSFRSNYNFNINDDALTSCFMPSAFFTEIKNSISRQESRSFDYISMQDNLPKKCFILPSEIKNGKFATLLIIDNDKGCFDRNQNNEMRHHIIQADQYIKEHTSAIIASARNKNKKLHEDLAQNNILINALKIRNELEKLSMISRKSIKTQEFYLIDVNKYIIRTKELITELLGPGRIEFELDLCSKMLVTELCYDILDFLISNVVSACVKGTKGCAHLIVKTDIHPEGSFIALADNRQSCDAIEKLLLSAEEPENTKDITVIEKIISSYNGRLAVISNSCGRASIGFTLPPMPQRIEIAREPEEDKAISQGILSVLSTGLAELLDY